MKEMNGIEGGNIIQMLSVLNEETRPSGVGELVVSSSAWMPVDDLAS